MSISETASAISGLIKTILTAAFVCVVGYGGGWLYTTFCSDMRLQQSQHELLQTRALLDTAHQQVANQNQMIDRLATDLETSQRRIVQLDTSLRLLKVDRRVAEIHVISQEKNEAGDWMTKFEFQEVNKQGVAIDRRHAFEIKGDLLYLDFWIVKFDDQFVEEADLDKSTSICLFRRMFGEHQEPYEGYTIDSIGNRPSVYGKETVITEFERQIWADFWNIANNPSQAAAMGIRAAHGVAPAMRLRANQRYRVTLRASDGLSIVPIEEISNPT